MTAEQKPKPVEYVFCADECKEKVPREEIEGSGWEYLQITNRYRCLTCKRALEAINGVSDAR